MEAKGLPQTVEVITGRFERNPHRTNYMMARLQAGRHPDTHRDFWEEEFQRYATLSGGRLKVERDEFTAPRAGRVSQPTQLVNIIATLEPLNIPMGGHYAKFAACPRHGHP